MTIKQLHHAWWIVPHPSHHNSSHAVIVQSLQAIPELKVTIGVHRAAEVLCRGFFQRLHPHLVPRITFIGYGSSDLAPTPENSSLLIKDCIENAIPALEQVERPDRFVCGMFTAELLAPAVRAKWPGVQVWLHWTASAGWLYNILRPSPDGNGDYKEVVARLSSGKDMAPQERMGLVAQVIFAGNGTTQINDHVVQLPGLPPMHNYELHSDKVDTPPAFLLFMVKSTVEGAALVDGITLNTSEQLEGDMLKALTAYTNVRPFGLQSDPRAWTRTAVLQDGPVKSFLDSHRGSKGVFYISFGTFYTPRTNIEECIDLLVASDQPFLIVGPTPALLLPQVAEKVASCPHGHFQPTLVDQIAVLSHPSTKWFMTHGGWASIQESLVLGVPLIVWPLANNDQPYNAALLSTRDKPLGIELVQTRLGPYARKAHRGVNVQGTPEGFKEEFKVVLEEMHGAKGLEIRKNVEEFSAKVLEEHKTTSQTMKSWVETA